MQHYMELKKVTLHQKQPLRNENTGSLWNFPRMISSWYFLTQGFRRSHKKDGMDRTDFVICVWAITSVLQGAYTLAHQTTCLEVGAQIFFFFFTLKGSKSVIKRIRHFCRSRGQQLLWQQGFLSLISVRPCLGRFASTATVILKVDIWHDKNCLLLGNVPITTNIWFHVASRCLSLAAWGYSSVDVLRTHKWFQKDISMIGSDNKTQ